MMEEQKQTVTPKPAVRRTKRRHWGLIMFAFVNILTGIYMIASLGFMVTPEGVIGQTSDTKLLGSFFIALLWWFIAYLAGRSHRLPPLIGLLCAQAMPLFVFLPGFLKLVGYWALSPWLPIYQLMPFKSKTAVAICLLLYALITVLLWMYASFWRKSTRTTRRKAANTLSTAPAEPKEAPAPQAQTPAE